MTTRPYRPSNGTEGDIFRARFCDRCTRDFGRTCTIYNAAFWGDIDEPGYPPEWVVDESNTTGESARCTAFNDRDEARAKRNAEARRSRAVSDLFTEGE